MEEEEITCPGEVDSAEEVGVVDLETKFAITLNNQEVVKKETNVNFCMSRISNFKIHLKVEQ